MVRVTTSFLSTRSHDCENWIVTEWILQQSEASLGELAKRAWSKHHSNTAAVTALEMESVRSRLLVRKRGSEEDSN